MYSNFSGLPPHGAGLIRRAASRQVPGSLASSSSAWAFAQDEGLSELGHVYQEHQELTIMNQVLRETCAEWVSAILQVQSTTREAMAERDRLMQHIISLDDGGPDLVDRILMSQQVHAEPSARFPPTAPIPELGEVPSTRLSANLESRLVLPNQGTILSQSPMNRFSPLPAATQFMEAGEAEQAEHALPRQPSGDRQEGRRHERRQRRRRRTEAPNGHHQATLRLMAQINQAQVLAQHVTSNAQHHFPAEASSASSMRQLGRHRYQHSSRSALMHSAGTSLNHAATRFVALPTAAAAA